MTDKGEWTTMKKNAKNFDNEKDDIKLLSSFHRVNRTVVECILYG